MNSNLCKLTLLCSIAVFAIASPCCAQTNPTNGETDTTPTADISAAASTRNPDTPLTAQSTENPDTPAPVAAAPANPRIPIPSKLFPFIPSMQQ